MVKEPFSEKKSQDDLFILLFKQRALYTYMKLNAGLSAQSTFQMLSLQT